MPYIKKNYRDQFDSLIDDLVTKVNLINDIDHQEKDGLLNYIFTSLLDKCYPNPNYHRSNEMIGILECCKLEMYRKSVAPYEDLKIRENGEVLQKCTKLSDGY